MRKYRALRPPHPLPRVRLEKLFTQSLLQILKVARYAKLGLWDGPYPDIYVPRQRGESFETHQKRVAEVEADWIRRKEEIETYEAAIKQILAMREHMPRATL